MNGLKHWIQQRLIQAKISDNKLLESICLECKQASRQILKSAIKKHKALHNDKNTHEELWKKTDTGFELEAAVENFDWYINAKIEFDKETNLYVGIYQTGCMGLDRGNIHNELFLEDMGLKDQEHPIKDTDYKVIMREIYYMHQNELNEFIKQKAQNE